MKEIPKKVYDLFDELHDSKPDFNLSCLTHCSGVCEEGPVLLLPYENEYLAHKSNSGRLLFPQIVLEDGTSCGYMSVSDPDCSCMSKDGVTCKLYPLRPIDCSTYPVFPKFNLDNTIEFQLSKECPLWDTISADAINYSIKVWEKLLNLTTMEWRLFYNKEIVSFFDKSGIKKISI